MSALFRIFGGTCCCIIFVIIGYSLYNGAENYTMPKIVGLANIIFFGFFAIFGFYQILKKLKETIS